MLLSLVIAPAIAAAPLYFGIMPRIDQYEELIPWLCIAFVPLLYLQTSRNPRTMILAMLLSIRTLNQQYPPVRGNDSSEDEMRPSKGNNCRLVGFLAGVFTHYSESHIIVAELL